MLQYHLQELQWRLQELASVPSPCPCLLLWLCCCRQWISCSQNTDHTSSLTCYNGHAEDGRGCQQQQEGEPVAGAVHVDHVAHHHTGSNGTAHSCDTGITHVMPGKVQALPDNWKEGLQVTQPHRPVSCLYQGHKSALMFVNRQTFRPLNRSTHRVAAPNSSTAVVAAVQPGCAVCRNSRQVRRWR